MATDPFDALGDPNRRAILALLGTHERSVQQLADALPISRPAVSRHLRVLKQAGLVTDRPEGTRRLYRLQDHGVDAVRAYVEQVWGEAAARFQLAADNPSGPERVLRAGADRLADARAAHVRRELERALERERAGYRAHHLPPRGRLLDDFVVARVDTAEIGFPAVPVDGVGGPLPHRLQRALDHDLRGGLHPSENGWIGT